MITAAERTARVHLRHEFAANGQHNHHCEVQNGEVQREGRLGHAEIIRYRREVNARAAQYQSARNARDRDASGNDQEGIVEASLFLNLFRSHNVSPFQDVCRKSGKVLAPCAPSPRWAHKERLCGAFAPKGPKRSGKRPGPSKQKRVLRIKQFTQAAL